MWSKDDSRDIACVLSCLFPFSPSCVKGFASAISDSSTYLCSPAFSTWSSGNIVAGASVRLAIATFVGLKAFSDLTQDTVISWYVNELYCTIFFSINVGTGAYLVEYTLMLFCPWAADGTRMASISAGVFSFNSSMYIIFPFLFLRTSILVGSTSNYVADFSSPLNTKDIMTKCPNTFLQFSYADPAEWIRIRSCDPFTLNK